MGKELWSRSATELAGMIREKAVSSKEVVESHISRIEAVNPSINAVTALLAESALAGADSADQVPASGPLHGVPFSIKENIDCMGSATTQGIPAFENAMPSLDAPQVVRMKAAGAIPLARTNLPELGLRITTDNPLRGRTLNPWDSTRTAGGSSGGEAAAIASGMSPIGLGNDIGGSLRNPAYCCGITSLKPTTGRIPQASSIPPEDFYLAAQLMAVQGPMARHVADLQLGFEILSGRDLRDPVSVDAPLKGPAPQQKRVALVTSIPGVELPAASVDAIRQAGIHLSANGWEVVETQPPEIELINELWGHLLSADIRQSLPMISPVMTEDAVWLLEQLIAIFDDAAMSSLVLHTERYRLGRLWSSFFDAHPLVIGPTWTDIPFLHDADIDRETGVHTTLDRIRFITPGNVLGIPAVALPMGVADGLPTGVQIYADLWREDLCLQAAAEIEANIGQIGPIDPVG